MNTDTTNDVVPKRPYKSAVRSARKEETRQHILDTLIEKMVQGNFNSSSMDEIARAAGIGVATLYRHFPNREALLDSLTGEFNRRVGDVVLPKTPEDLVEITRRSSAVFDQFPGLVQAFFLSDLGRHARMRGRARRLKSIREALEAVTAGIEEPQRTQMIAAIAYLGSLQSWVTMTTEFGLTGDQAGQAAAWAIQTLVNEIRAQTSSGKPGE